MVHFPGFGLTFPIQPIAFRWFGVDIYFYAICIVVAILMAMVCMYRSKEKFGIKIDFLSETLMLAIIVGFIGARIYYVAFNFENYEKSMWRIFFIRDGGLAIYGGLLAGCFVILKRCQKYKVDVLDFLDYVTPFIALGQAIGRWGNFFNQEAYGTQTTNIFRMGIHTIEGYQEVHPAFLYESVATFLIFCVLRVLQKHRGFRGEIVALYLLFYSCIRMLIEGIRMDSLMLYQFRISQILSGAIFVFSGIMLLKKRMIYTFNRLKSSKLQKKVYKKPL